MQQRHRKLSLISIAMILLFTFTLLGCQQDLSSDSSDQVEENHLGTETEESEVEEEELLDSKPEVADIQVNNEPNRMITSFNGDPRTQMGFNWYTTELFDNAKVWVSTSEDLSDAIVFDAEATAVTNRYAERTDEGYFIFADVEMDDEENPIEDENGDLVINGFYTDEGKAGSEWTNGSNIGYLDLIDVTENVYKAIATDLEPDTKYYYQVGSESGEKSSIGTFETAGESGDEFTFIHYTDTQNAYWNEHVRNEATFGADTIKQALEVNEDSNFVLHTGDLVQIADVEDE